MGEEVGAVAEGLSEGHLSTPAADGGVIACGEDIGDGRAAEVGGAGVLGVVEDAAGAVGGAGNAVGGLAVAGVSGLDVGDAEALVAAGVCVAEDAGKEADCGVEDNGGGELATAEDVVADGEFFVGEEVGDALVHALVAAADEDDAFEGGEVARSGLGEGLALRGEQDYGLASEVAGGLWRDSI